MTENGNGSTDGRLSFPPIEPEDISQESWLISAKALIGFLLVLQDEGYTFDEAIDIVIGVFDKVEKVSDVVEFKALMSELQASPGWGSRRDVRDG